MMSYSPVDAFSAASGIDPFRLKLMMAIIFLSMLLLAVAWALNSGYKGFSFRDNPNYQKALSKVKCQ
ncbi:TPA: DUF3262 family protein [Mannheimia haemolytica]